VCTTVTQYPRPIPLGSKISHWKTNQIHHRAPLNSCNYKRFIDALRQRSIELGFGDKKAKVKALALPAAAQLLPGQSPSFQLLSNLGVKGLKVQKL
jgi:hypothetical protein